MLDRVTDCINLWSPSSPGSMVEIVDLVSAASESTSFFYQTGFRTSIILRGLDRKDALHSIPPHVNSHMKIASSTLMIVVMSSSPIMSLHHYIVSISPVAISLRLDLHVLTLHL